MSNTPVVLNFPEKYPELLEEIGQVIGCELVTLGLVARDGAYPVAFKITEAIRTQIGGTGGYYVPKGVEYELNERDKKIWDAFNGDNLQELAIRFDLSYVQIRTIIKRARAVVQKKNQISLLD